MASGAPTGSEIRAAKRNAVGGGRKRCRKGKNCSAACIQAGMVCLVEMPDSAGLATTRMRDFLQSGERKSSSSTQTATPLTGDALIAKVKELGPDTPKEELVRASGYLTQDKKPDFIRFYEAILEAKGLKSGLPIESKSKTDEKDAERAQRYEKEAKKVKLTRDEKKALQDYTDGQIDQDDKKRYNYFRINETLREGEDEWSLRDVNPKLADQILSTDNALGRLPKNDDREVFYRGITFSPDSREFDQFANMKPGDSFSDSGYSSFSASKQMAKDFYGETGGGDFGNNKVLFVSKHPNLTPVNAFSKHPEEIEAILPRRENSTVSWVREGKDGAGAKVMIIGLDYD